MRPVTSISDGGTHPARAAWQTLAYVVLLVTLILGSAPREEGDSHEYVAMALQMASMEGPALTPPELESIRAELEPFISIPFRATVPASGFYYFPHFWFYPLLAVPGVALTRALAVHPVYGFTLLNLVLLGGAAWVLFRRQHWTVALLILASPIVWWIDKAHTEVFTFSMLAIAMTVASAQPGIAMICAGAAATQNPPIALAIPLIALAATRGEWRRLGDRTVWGGAAIGMLLAFLHPLYYILTTGGPTALGTRGVLPSAQELGAVLWDPNLGLLVAFPLFVLVVVTVVIALLIREPMRLGEPVVLLSLGLAALFLLAFSQAPNINSGATLSMSRYGLWLIPLAIPVLGHAHAVFGLRLVRWAGVVVIVSAVSSVAIFRPSVFSRYLQPTAAAEWLWTRFPQVNNPIPEIFAERVAHGEAVVAPIALPTCEKVLLIGAADRGMWPVPCAPESVPDECLEPGAACYANRSGGRYAFKPVDRREYHFFEPSSDRVWPRSAETTVGAVLDNLSWWELEPPSDREPKPTMVRAVYGAAGTRTLEAADRLFLVLARPARGARVTLRPPMALEGGVIDLVSPGVVKPLAYRGAPGEIWNVDIDGSDGLVILFLQGSFDR